VRSTLVRITTATSLMAVGGLLLTSGLAGASDDPMTTETTAAVVVDSAPVQEQSTKAISAGNLDDHSCSEAWRFVITKVGGDSTVAAPDSISVSWANGASATVGLSYMEGTTAHYRIGKHLDSTVVSATAVIDSEWRGSFKLSHGPCTTETTVPDTTVTETTVPETSVPDTTTASTVPEVNTTAGAPTSVASGGAAAPAQQLPSTGSTASTLALSGIALVAVGAGLLSVRRRPTHN
jgi:LPXTG-motif cell wall-anchored protein